LTPRRYGAGHVSELLRAHGKKLDDEQVGRGLNEVCAGWMQRQVGMNARRNGSREARRVPSRLIRGREKGVGTGVVAGIERWEE